jgi:succinylglutamic semialdehyde dehydrogenase
MQFIHGIWERGESAPLCSTDPSTGETVWDATEASTQQVARAVDAAREAFPDWSAKSYQERLAYLERFRTGVEQRAEELSLLISRETGKLLWDARSETSAVVGKLKFAAASHEERAGEKVTVNASAPGQASALRHRPHGVVAVFGPYNFPAHLPNGHIMPALLSGNTIIFKPSELTPAVAEWMVRLWDEVGLPKGVLNLVQGTSEVGKALAAERIDGLLFTGSSNTGKLIHRQFAGRPEILIALEMGGNNPLIVFEPEDIKAAVRETILSAFLTTGQRCTCARRLILPNWKQRDEFLHVLIDSVSNLVVGSYKDTSEAFMGPLVSLREKERVLSAQAQLEAAGGKVLLSAKSLHPELPFVSPSLIDVTGVQNVPDEEIFGPLLKIQRVETMEDAWRVANSTQYGLSAGILTRHRSLYEEGLKRLRCGLVNWNRQTTGASGNAPFGGVGASGNHRPAGYYSADYCAYPVASIEVEQLQLPASLEPGLKL